MPTPQQVVNDPNFLKLSPADKKTVLGRIDPKFSRLSADDQDQVVNSIGGLPGIPAPPNPLNQRIQQEKNLHPIFDRRSVGSYGFPAEAGKQAGEFVSNLGRQAKNLFLHPLTPASEAFSPEASIGPAMQAATAGGGSAIKTALAGADVLAGGNPVAGAYNWDQGEKGKALADFLTVPLLQFGAGKMIDTLPGLKTGEPEVFTPANRENLAALLSDSMQGQGNIMQRGGLIDRLLPYLRMAGKENNFSTKSLRSEMPSREFDIAHPFKSGAEMFRNQKTGDFRVMRGIGNVQKVFDTTEQLFDRQFQTLMNEYKTSPVDFNGIADRIVKNPSPEESAASKTLTPTLEGIRDRILNYAKQEGNTIDAADRLRKEFNKLADTSEKAAKTGANAAADLEASDAYRRAADEIREGEYDALAQNSSIPKDQIRKLQQLHGDAVVAKRAIHDSIIGNQREQYLHQANKTERILLGRSGERTIYGKGVLSRTFVEGPYGELNKFARRSLRGLEQGGTPDKILPELRTEKQLPVSTVDVPQWATIEMRFPGAQKQLPPLTGAEAQGAGAPDVQGGVFPQRPEISSPSRISSQPTGGEGEPAGYEKNGAAVRRYPGQKRIGGLSPLTPKHYSYHRNPFFVTDYVGSGARGEEAAMPGTSRGMVHIDSQASAERALHGYDQFRTTDAYKNLDPSAKQKFQSEYDHLKAYAQQGEVGPPRNTPPPRVNVTQWGEPVHVTSPEQARDMLEALSETDFSNLTGEQVKQMREVISQLDELARSGDYGPAPRKMGVHPGRPGERLSRRPQRAAKAIVRTGVAASSSYRPRKDLPGLEEQ